MAFPQSHEFDLGQRRRNLSGIFIVLPGAIEQRRGRQVVLVDDVMTIGETLHEFAWTLRRLGTAAPVNASV